MNSGISRRAVLAAMSMLTLSMTTPGFSIEIAEADLSLLQADSSTHRFEQRQYAAANGKYRILLCVPKAVPKDGGYSVLYLLDGDAAFAALSVEQLAAVPNLVVAAIGYDGDKAFDVKARSRDYTPPHLGQTAPEPDPLQPERLVGGAPQFLDYLTGGIREVVEAGIEVEATKRTLWGHSFGGLFTLYALFTRPGTFDRYVAVSPSLWWGNGALQRFEDDAVPRRTPAVLKVLLGDRENRSTEPPLEHPRPAPATMAMIDRLHARQDLLVESQVFKGARHGETLALSLPFALELAAR